MKTKYIIINLWLLVCTVINAQNWIQVNTIQNEWFKKVYALGKDTLYVIGKNGLIAKSVDKAQHWTKQYPINKQLNDIVLLRDSTGIVVGNDGTILKTTDNGLNWVAKKSNTNDHLISIAVVDLNNFWVVGENGIVLNTIDGGETWNKKEIGSTSRLNDISIKDGVGFIVGNSVFYKTLDSGVIWLNENLPHESLSLENINLLSVNQTSKNLYYLLIATDEYRGTYLSKTNSSNIVLSEYLNNFTIINDSIGYGSHASITTNSDNIIKIYEFNNGHYVNDTKLYPSGIGQVDYTHSDLSMIGDSIGYVISGNYLFMKSSSTVNSIKWNNSNYKLEFRQTLEGLLVNSREAVISKVDIYDLYGKSIYNCNLNSCCINIKWGNIINNGPYLIRTTLLNGNSFINKIVISNIL